VVETADSTRKKRYVQTFKNNMSEKSAPAITASKASDSFTCITFQPDLAKFGMTHLEEDTVALMSKRVYDMAGVLGKGVKVPNHSTAPLHVVRYPDRSSCRCT
jgi:DNA topoisomerase II